MTIPKLSDGDWRVLCALWGAEDGLTLGQVVEGLRDGRPWFWTILTLEDGSRHVDPSREDGFLLTDEQLLQAGYAWDQSDYPACGLSAAPAASPSENGEISQMSIAKPEFI